MRFLPGFAGMLIFDDERLFSPRRHGPFLMPRKALLLNYCYPGQGTYFRCLYFARGLAAAGWHIDLVCASAKAGDWRIRSHRLEEGITLYTLPSPWAPGSVPAYFIRTLIGVVWVLFGRYDVIHAFGTALPSTALPAAAARIFGKKAKRLLDWDDAWGEAYQEMFSRPAHILLAYFEDNAPRWAGPHGVTTVSRHFQTRLLKMGVPMERIHRIPNGADTALIRPIGRDAARLQAGWHDEQVIVSMGHNYFGSLRILLRTFEEVRRRKPKAKLKMVGALLRVGKWEPKIDAILGEFAHLSPAIEWVGEVKPADLAAYLCAADVLVLPMQPGVMDEARAPIRLGDYLASGRPVVSNAVGYVREILEQGNAGMFCADPTDMHEFARKIVAVLDDASLARAMGEAGLRLATGAYNWREIGARVAAVYDLACETS